MKSILLASMITVCVSIGAEFDGQKNAKNNEPDYKIAFAKFALMNTDIFNADADGNNSKPLRRKNY